MSTTISRPAPLPWEARTRSQSRRLPASWPLVAGFLLLPIWWGLGVSGVMLPVLAAPLALGLLFRRHVSAPKGFGLYMLFLLWCALSAFQVEEARQGFSLVYRGTLYLTAGLLFLHVLNASHRDLPAAAVVRTMAAFFAIVVVGGLVGMVIPNVSFTTPARTLMPSGLLADRFVADLVAASTSSGRAFAAYPIFRPKAPFIYANEWGAAYAMSLPFAVCALGYVRTKRTRDALALLLVVSVFPLVFSLNRGAWLSASAAMLYAAVRMVRGRNAQLLRLVAVGALVIGGLLFVTPLGEIVQTRLTNGYGDAHRERLYTQSIELVRASPAFGHGAPVRVEGNLSAGTHGQLWTILVSQGLPGLALFVGWLAWAWWKASRPLPRAHPGDRQIRLWCEVAIFTAFVQMPYYDLLPWGLSIAMIAAAVAWRESARPGP